MIRSYDKLTAARNLRQRALARGAPQVLSQAAYWLPNQWAAFQALADWSDDECGGILAGMTEDDCRMAMLFVAEALESET